MDNNLTLLTKQKKKTKLNLHFNNISPTFWLSDISNYILYIAF